ncbi:hypothetical protein TUM17576_41930 [Enterobacter hormaechei]|nr:hypothetical protein [Enterobacter hormaechei]GJL37373.1 hypothetical protein TUM17576_41930 [Enterobacter hormaechei]
MKTPIDMLHDIAAQISEGNTLLENIYKNTDVTDEKTDSAIACLIQSLDKTRETSYVYIEELIKNKKTVSSGVVTSNQLNSWSADIGNCRMALGDAMDCLPQELSAIGTLTIVYEKLNDLQETICKQADKIDS